MHGIDQNQALLDSTFSQALFDFRSYINEFTTSLDMKPQFLAVVFHNPSGKSIGF
jgi:hypothetical protein